MESLHPVLAQWIIEDGYGKVLSRSGLTIFEREFVAIAVLAVLGWNRQLESHIRGAMNIGVRRSMLNRLFLVITPFISRRQIGVMVKVVNS